MFRGEADINIENVVGYFISVFGDEKVRDGSFEDVTEMRVEFEGGGFARRCGYLKTRPPVFASVFLYFHAGARDVWGDDFEFRFCDTSEDKSLFCHLADDSTK